MSQNKNARTSASQLVPANLLQHGDAFWERKLVCDLHGVVFDWITPFARFASTVLKRTIDPKAIRLYHAGYQADVAISPSEWDELFGQFARLAKGGYGDLEPYPGIVEDLRRIAKAGIEIEIWTWTPGASELQFAHEKAFGSGIAQGATLKLIERHNLPVDIREVQFMPASHKAIRMANEHIPLILEDCPWTAVQVGTGVGGACIMLPHPYNANVKAPGVTRLKKRSDLVPTTLEFFKTLDKAGCLL